MVLGSTFKRNKGFLLMNSHSYTCSITNKTMKLVTQTKKVTSKRTETTSFLVSTTLILSPKQMMLEF